MVNYADGKVYQIVGDFDGALTYVGSTTQTLAKRLSLHRSHTKANYRPGCRLHDAMREHGADRFHIVLIESVPCANKWSFYARSIA